jgi:hemerythrin
MKVIWEPIYSVNVKEIDDQHIKLIDFINDAHSRLNQSNNILADSDDFYPRLIQHAIDHFDTEEKYFAKFQYDGAEEHIAKHNEIKAKTIEFELRFKKEKSTQILLETLQFLDDWLFVHIMEYDKKYTKCFNVHGLY